MKIFLTLFLAVGLAMGAVAITSEQADRNTQQPHKNYCLEGDACATATATTVGSVAMTGEQAFSNCAVCHVAGVAGAPRVDFKVDWRGRLDKGAEQLTMSVVNGMGAMPPGGACANCSPDDLAAAVDYMLMRVKQGN